MRINQFIPAIDEVFALICIKRAGATIIITYFAKDLPELIRKYQS